ncbi:AAA family ATPase [Aeromonas salmonicida]|uniref:AAA family ATPase n=1 Tax=Aeromonas salmonicida TaxID=645 RepID=UPI000C1C210D|nr:AAA family ATPase [Aeromonas salmonicida]ATU97289.1 AAA family ATPase [Aeromonas salmonicida]
MSGYLTKIKAKIPYSDKEVDIDVDGKTLILTGGNGCGKTQLMDHIFSKLKESVIDRKNYTIQQLNNSLSSYQHSLKDLGPAHQSYNHFKEKMEITKARIKEVEEPSIIIKDLEGFIVKYQAFKAILISFEAMRKSEIKKPSSVTSLEQLRSTDKGSTHIRRNNTSDVFEEFLVTNIANQAFSESKKINDDPEEAKRIEKWFNKLEADLQDLFEDKMLKLVFKSDSLSFEIHQPHKNPYTFQSLSSGFSSIMAVYADLITKVSLRSIDPDELTGIVLIDEIDAHLHVSLQKKILAFLKKAFPKVQFIVSTHSPFVVSSVDDAVIYDLSRLEQVNDLSMYSYEAVLEGLFGVLPISSLLQKNIEKLAALLKTSPLDMDGIQALLNLLPSDDTTLDDESLYFVKSAKIALSKAKRS